MHLASKLPYVVVSRRTQDLLNGLNSNEAPILFEGLHTCFYIDHKSLVKRKKLVRMHNIEHDYYRGLHSVQKRGMKKWYFNSEANKLEQFESKLKHADHILSISKADQRYLSSKFDQASILPVFHSSESISAKTGRGEYAFYHGNLAVGENNKAALFLVNEVFNSLDHKLIIAGSGASQDLISACSRSKNITLKSDLTSGEIEEHVQEAQVNVLPTFQSTGIKLKLVLSLFKGRFCIANDDMIADTGLEKLCINANTLEEWKTHVNDVFQLSFDQSMVSERSTILNTCLNNQESAKIIIEKLS